MIYIQQNSETWDYDHQLSTVTFMKLPASWHEKSIQFKNVQKQSITQTFYNLFTRVHMSLAKFFKLNTYSELATYLNCKIR